MTNVGALNIFALMKKQVLTILAFSLCLHAHAQDTAAPAAKSAWKNESEVSLVRNDGNSKNETYNVKQTTSYNFDPTILKATASYHKAQSEDVNTGVRGETARKWDAGLRVDHVYSDRLNYFAEYLVESDKFAGYQQRHNSSAGAKIFFYRNGDRNNVFGEIGPSYIHENQVNGNQVHYASAKVYIEGNYAISETSSARLWVEFKPNFRDQDDYLFNYEASLTSNLNSNFALKVAYLSKTDNKPVAKEKTDTTFTTALLATFN